MNHLYETAGDCDPDVDDSTERFGHRSDRFIDAFGGYCASMVVLLNTLAYLDPPEPLDDSNDLVYGLCVVAGTVGYPLFDDQPSDLPPSDSFRGVTGTRTAAADGSPGQRYPNW